MDTSTTVRPVQARSVRPRRLRLLLVVVLAAAMTATTPFVGPAAAAGAAATLSVAAPVTATAGAAFSITVTARDAAGAVATSYRGRVTFTSTDTRSPVLPAAYTFTAADNGRHTFTGVRLFTAGSRTVAAFDTVRATVKGRSVPIAVAPAAASRLLVQAPGQVVAGAGASVTVTAKDRYFNVATGYRGTVTFSTTDPADPGLPAPYTFTAADRGVHLFRSVVLAGGGGGRTITVRDQGGVSGTSGTISVVPRHAAYGEGLNTYGQVGTSAAESLGTVTLSMPDTRWVRLAAGGQHTAAIRSDGTLWTWGLNEFGQLGSGPTGFLRGDPRRVGTRSDWASLATGFATTMAIKTNGTLWAWGANPAGVLGDGTDTARTGPVQVGAGRSWASVSTQEAHSAAVATDGTLWAWGFNAHGQVGDGTTVDRWTPVQIGADHDWIQVSVGPDHTLAVKSDGSLWAWGSNSRGELGDGTTTERHSPVRIGTGTGWASVEAGQLTSFAIRTDGTLWAWGWNTSGQLGDGTRTDRHAPRPILTERRWAAVSSAPGPWWNTVALGSDGTAWSWGVELVPPGTPRPPRQLGGHATFVAVSAGTYHSMGLSSRMLP